MTLTSRLYTGTEDFYRMRDFLIENKRINPYSAMHIGDLNWWVYYDPSGILPTEKVRLWEQDGKLIAWAWMNPAKFEFELFIQNGLFGSREEAEILHYMVDWLTDIARTSPNKPETISAFASNDETHRIALLESNGFMGSDFLVMFAQDITGDLPDPKLPEGYQFLDRMTLDYAADRAAAHLDAFQKTSKMTPDYYRQFMTAPDYDPTLDIVTLAPDGRVAAYAMGYIDEANQLSVYEPVGTRHEFQRRGLGKATLLEGLRRFKARGVKMALVSTGAEDTGNIAFYQSAGFKIVNMVRQYKKSLA